MSNLKVQASPTGTGVVTLTAPTTNTDRTVTLPDTTGTLYISGGDIGTPSAGNGSNLTNLNASNLASGTVPTARLATGTADSTTFLRGDQTWAAAGSTPNVQQFDSSGTWTKPSGVSMARIQVWGGGGGAGRSNAGNLATYFSGGAGGGYSEVIVPLSTLASTVSVTIGAGGTGRTGSNGTGTAGGTSSFGSHCTAYGGGAGHGIGTGSVAGYAGGGSPYAVGQNANTGTPNSNQFLYGRPYQGQTNDDSSNGIGRIPTPYHGGGPGQDSLWGGGGGASGGGGSAGISVYGGAGGALNTAGTQPGGGGGCGSAINTDGKNGAAGRVIVTCW